MEHNIAGHALLETLTHPNELFPMSEFVDHFDSFSNGGFPSHWHPELEFQLILKGSAEYVINGTSYLVKEGDALYIAPEVIHHAKQTRRGTIGYNIVLSPQLLTNVLRAVNCVQYAAKLTSGYSDALLISSDSKHGFRILERLRKMYYADTTQNDNELFMLENLLGIWRHLITLLPHQETSASTNKIIREYRMKAMLAYIHRNYSEPISVSDLADAANISSTECFRCFSELSETTPVEYVNQYRLLQASQLLLDTDQSIAEICFSTGFGSTSYFTKQFKRRYGMTPRAYRVSGIGDRAGV